MFKKHNIRSRVISIIENRISSAQKEYDETAKHIDETTAESIKVITEQAISQKNQAEDNLVDNIIGRI